MKSAYFDIHERRQGSGDEAQVLQSNINPNTLYPFLQGDGLKQAKAGGPTNHGWQPQYWKQVHGADFPGSITANRNLVLKQGEKEKLINIIRTQNKLSGT